MSALSPSTGALIRFPRFWTAGGVFRWNLFNGGQVEGQIDVEDARTAQALAVYEQTVLLAFEEVESAMTSFVQSQNQLEALERAVDAAQRASSQSVSLYSTGVRSFDSVLDSQRTLLNLEDQATAVRGEVTEQLIRIYKALGGGWMQTVADEAEDEAGAAPEAPN